MKKNIQEGYKEEKISHDEGFRGRIMLNHAPGDINCRSYDNKAVHSTIEIKYFFEGEVVLLAGDDTIVTQPGDIVLINPYEIHTTIDCGEPRARYHIFMIELDVFGEENFSNLDLYHLLIVKRLRFNHLIRDNKRLQSILLQITKEHKEKGKNHQLVIRGLLLEFFALLFRDEVETEESNIGSVGTIRYYTCIEPALRKIRNDYRDKIVVSELAELCNVSTSHFCRMFKTVTNMTVVEYVEDYRFKMANLMLTRSGNSIEAVAQSCGFDNASYFCCRYKKKYGISPSKSKVKLSAKE